MISKYHGNVTRLDLAYDDHMGVIDIHRFVYDIREQNYRSKSKKHEIVESMDQNTGILGISVYIGRKESDVMIRVYDKAAERGYTDRHWIRIELQLRHDRAAAALDQLLQRESIGVLSAGVLRNYLTVCVPTSDSNKSRWPIAYYWERVLGQIETIRLWATPGEPYNFYKTEDHLIKQYCQFLLAFTEMHGTIHDLLLMARQYHGKKDLKPKYKNAIIEHFSRIRKSGSSLPPMSDGCNSAVAYFSNEIFNLLYDDDVNFPF